MRELQSRACLPASASPRALLWNGAGLASMQSTVEEESKARLPEGAAQPPGSHIGQLRLHATQPLDVEASFAAGLREARAAYDAQGFISALVSLLASAGALQSTRMWPHAQFTARAPAGTPGSAARLLFRCTDAPFRARLFAASRCR